MTDHYECDEVAERDQMHIDDLAAERDALRAVNAELLAACMGLVAWAGRRVRFDARIEAAKAAIARAEGGAA